MSAARKRPASQRGKKRAASPPRPAPAAGVDVETVAARLLALALASSAEGTPPALWRKTDLGRELSRAEKPHLDAALERLQADGQMVALAHGTNVFFAFAGPLRERLHVSVVPTSPSPEPSAVDLLDAYRRLVRESGGFPDMKISLLARALGPAAAAQLPERLRAAWRAGDATLSLGDWSLASEEMRAAAVELDGEKYLLVRFEE